MVNLTANSVVFNLMGLKLSERVRAALGVAVEQHLILGGLQGVSLETVTTKTNIRAAFAKFVQGRVLLDVGRQLDKAYVECALEAYEARAGHLTKDLFDTVMAADEYGPYSYKRSYALNIKSGLGLFLVALHSSGAITLPSTFTWPQMHKEGGRRFEIGRYVASELLSFVRTLDSQAESLPHPAFETIGGDRKRREWFLTYATKLLLASGWHKPEDANIADLLQIKAAEKVINEKNGVPLAYGALLDVLNLAFPGRINVTSESWTNSLRLTLSSTVNAKGQKVMVAKALLHLFKDEPRTDHDLLEEILHLAAAWGKPERIRSLTRLPGLDADITVMSKLWLDMEDLYVSKVTRESYRPIYSAVGWWNVYLFYYLPYWFARNPGSSWVFPSSPSLLVKSVFVSRLLPTEEETPVTFIEFMNIQAEKRKWGGNSFYGTLRQLQGFFEFVERYSEEIPGCEGFTQPLAPHDFPRNSRSKNTNKQPVPRRFFGVYLDYHEALIAYHSVVLNKVLAGELSEDGLKRLEANGNIIDTFATSDLVGFIPVLITRTKTLALQFIPNVLDIRSRTVRDGRTLRLPHPHSLHQNLVALHTGVRHNHIQWLDRDKFDALVDKGDTEFSILFVNTDKQKTTPWTPHVSFRVIELLRAQRKWCELIENPSFHSEHFYNDNPSTKWPKFRPLFAYTSMGKPHHDEVYNDVWKSVLCGLQGLMPDLPELGQSRRVLHLLPPGHEPDDPDLQKKLIDYGATFTKMGESCPLRVHTASTPHSARVAVVSQYITFLATDLIGKYITGQKPGTVAYYVHLDQEALETEQVYQAARMREAALKGAFEPVLKGGEASTAFIYADNLNSNLARSMKAGLEETIASHGGMNISFSERTKGGVAVLLETGGADVAFNKTEVCPYGNNCPPDVVKELKGLRRCGLCPYAVRFIDHLPAVMAKKRQVADAVDELEIVLAVDAKTLNTKYTPAELDMLDADRARLCEDLSGWMLNEEVLEVMRQRIVAGQDTRSWTVQRPEIIERDLRRVSVQTTESEYLLARLGECIAFPVLESPQVRARFDLLRRELLARAGKIREAFALSPVDPAIECAGMLKSLVASRGLTVSQVASLLEDEVHMTNLPKTNLRLLSVEDVT